MTLRLCRYGTCTRTSFARGWCQRHYRRWLRHGHPNGGRHNRTGCRIPDCPRSHYARDLCAMHYQRAHRYGDPTWTPDTVDEIAVDRAVVGDRPARMATAEREQVVRRLHRLGLTDPRIADHLDIGAGGVWAVRRRLGLAANAQGRRAAA